MKLMKIKEFAEVVSGSTPKTNIDEYWNGKYIWITPAEIDNSSKYIYDSKRKITEAGVKSCSLKLLKKNTVILTSRAPIGKVALAGNDLYCNQGFKNLVCDESIIYPKYIYYWLISKKEYLNSLGRGATFKEISKKIVEEIQVPVLSIDDQKRMAQILDKSQDLIDKRKEQIELLDELVKSRFVEMFGSPATNSKDWDTTTIGKITTDVRYGTSKSSVEGGKYPYLRMNNITYSGKLDLKDLKYIDIEDNELEKCIVRKGDVLFNRTNSAELIGKTCVFDLEEPMIIAGYIIRVRLIEEVLPIYLSMFLNSDYGKKLLRGMAKGAVNQANINAQELKSIKIPIPPVELQNQFADFVEQVDKLKFEMEKSLKELEDNFNSLMQKAFKGELF